MLGAAGTVHCGDTGHCADGLVGHCGHTRVLRTTRTSGVEHCRAAEENLDF